MVDGGRRSSTRGRPTWVLAAAVAALVVAAAAVAFRDDPEPNVGERGNCLLGKREEAVWIAVNTAYELGVLGTRDEIERTFAPGAPTIFSGDDSLRPWNELDAQQRRTFYHWWRSSPAVEAKTSDAGDAPLQTGDRSDCE